MAKAAVRADLGETLDRLRALAPQVTLDLEVGVDVLAERGDLGIGQVTHLRVGRQAERSADLARSWLADAVDVGQPDLEPLRVREVDACLLYTSDAADE